MRETKRDNLQAEGEERETAHAQKQNVDGINNY